MVDRVIELKGTHGSTGESYFPEYEVFYLLIKFVDTGTPVPSLTDTFWIRRGNTCSQMTGGLHCPWNFYTNNYYTQHTTLKNCQIADNEDGDTPHESNYGTEESSIPGLETRLYYAPLPTPVIQGFLSDWDRLISAGLGNIGGALVYRPQFGWENSPWSCGGDFVVGGREYGIYRSEEGDIYSVPMVYTLANQDGNWTSNKTTTEESSGKQKLHFSNGWYYYDFEFYYDTSIKFANATTFAVAIAATVEDHDRIEKPPDWRRFYPGCPQPPVEGNGETERPPEVTTPPTDPEVAIVGRPISKYKAEIYLCSTNKLKPALKVFELGASDLFSNVFDNLAFMQCSEVASQEIKKEATQLQKKNLIDLTFDNYKFKNKIDQFISILENGRSTDRPPISGDNSEAVSEILADFPRRLFDSLHQTLFLSIHSINYQYIQIKTGLKNIALPLSLENPQKQAQVFSNSVWEFSIRKFFKCENWSIVEIEESEYTTATINDWQAPLLKCKYLKYFDLFTYNEYSINSFLGSEAPNPEESLVYFPIEAPNDDPLLDEYPIEISCANFEANYRLYNAMYTFPKGTNLERNILQNLKESLFGDIFPVQKSQKRVWSSSYLLFNKRLLLKGLKGTFTTRGKIILGSLGYDNNHKTINSGFDIEQIRILKYIVKFNPNSNFAYTSFPRPDVIPTSVFIQQYASPSRFDSSQFLYDKITDNFFSCLAERLEINLSIAGMTVVPYHDSYYPFFTVYPLCSTYHATNYEKIMGVQNTTLIIQGYNQYYSFSLENNLSPIPDDIIFDNKYDSRPDAGVSEINYVLWEAICTGHSYYYVIEFNYSEFTPNIATSWKPMIANSEFDKSEVMDYSLKGIDRINSSYVKIIPPKNLSLTEKDINYTHVHAVKAVRLQ